MRSLRSSVTLFAVVTAAFGAAGCGDDANTEPATTSSQATAPATKASPTPIPTTPAATFVFDGDSLKPPVLRIPRVKSARLVLISADGRPHAAVITVGKNRQRLVVAPSGRGEIQLDGLQPGHRYRVVPDGATEPVTLVVG